MPPTAGKVKTVAEVAAELMVEKAPDSPPAKTILPRLFTVKSVVPDALAVMRSPLFFWFTIKAALLPIPPEIESGARVLVLEPIRTAELKSEVRTVLPEPFGVSVKLWLVPVVWIVAPAPLLSEMVEPASVRLPWVSRTFAELKKLMLPVEPSVKDWPLVVPSVPLPVKKSALFAVVPAILAVGVPAPTLRKPNFAELVALAPSRRSSLVFRSMMALLLSSVNGEPPFNVGKMPVINPAVPRFKADEERIPVALD